MRPIANQYREGKVKSTPMRGVKQTLKPDAYKQWERVLQIAWQFEEPLFFMPQSPAVASATLGFRTKVCGGRSALPRLRSDDRSPLGLRQARLRARADAREAKRTDVRARRLRGKKRGRFFKWLRHLMSP